MILVPNLIAALVDKAGLCLNPWTTFFQQFSQAPSPIKDIDVAASPFVYQVKEPGSIIVSGGTVSLVQFTRGQDTITLQENILIPVCIGDIITTTYSVLPEIKFLPNYSTRRNG